MQSAELKSIFDASIHTKLATYECLGDKIVQAGNFLVDTLKQGNKILACGNGGSAADAQHFASELLNRFEKERRSLPAIALTTDPSTMTSIGNDYGYDYVFERQVNGLGQPNDVLLAISTSGNSNNVLRAVAAAKAKGMFIVAFNGKTGGALSPLLRTQDFDLCIPSDNTARIQESHLLLIHCLCTIIDRAFD